MNESNKSDILATLMQPTTTRNPRQKQQETNNMDNNKENYLREFGVGSVELNRNQQHGRPTSGISTVTSTTTGDSTTTNSSIRQHKLKQRFTVIRKLGKGTYGKVQLAINKETGQEVAIKTIKKTKIENEQDLQRVRREIQIMSSIEHPHIIHIYEVFENKDKIVLVMQYAPGGELYEYVSQSKVLDDCEARRIFRQIATAIYYCHQNKICHRDLKLENILLDEKNNAKLADFGLSNVFDKRRQLKTFCGSPLYASPEIVQGSPYEGPEVDCWSLGVLLYTLVYGAMPFDGSNFKRLVKQIREACYFEPKQKSQASALIRQLLCADPTKRATIIDICSDQWVNGLSSQGADNLAPPQHNNLSLLKVAQDMSNLAPVRLDILHSLAPPTSSPSADHLERPPLQPVMQPGDKSANDQQRQQVKRPASRKTSLILDPTAAMNADDGNGNSSPIASYVVRDIGTKPVEADEVIAVPEPEPEEVAELSIEQEPVIETLPVEVKTDVEMVAEEAQEAEADSTSVEMEVPSEPLPEEPGAKQAAELKEPSLEEPPPEKVEEKVEEKPEEKPKKMKKKVVVVKKKKKVPKKADEETLAKPGEEEIKKEPAKGSKEPGKVKIPNTFQAPESSQAPPVKAAPETRRQSSLVSDVSQKLLQHLQGVAANGSNSAATIKGDQQQLASVRVSDKKSEFERRASLATQQQLAQQQQQQMRHEEAIYEPKYVEAVRELLNSLNAVEQTIVEPVNMIEPYETGELMKQSSVATSTPTADSPERERFAALGERDVERKLADCIRDLEEVGRKSPSLLEFARDERSDSAETIRAEPDNKIRSTLSIQMGDNVPEERSPRESPHLLKQQVGPAPIMRSYKKVTFTRDGACITETGKIYSAQADDGTVRRIERKSKITHYPPSGDQQTGGQQEEEEEEEEVVFGDPAGSRLWHERTSSRSDRPFEKLIMPTSELLMENFINRAETAAKHQQRRADSASSCSSGSTDAFDDIFDQWTGAISMFNQNNNLADFHGSLLNRGFGRNKSPFGRTHKSRVASSAAGTPRCESAEPKNLGLFGGRQKYASGYESDAAPSERRSQRQRPASAMGAARSTFGSQNLFSKHKDIFETDPFFDDFGLLPHESIKQRLKQHHKQLWKGSTPSLNADAPGTAPVVPEMRSQRRGLWQQMHTAEAPGTQLNASNSANLADFGRQQPEAALPPRAGAVAGQPLRRTISKTSLSQMLPPKQTATADMQQAPARQHSASFIELKRASSSSMKQAQEAQMMSKQVESGTRVVSTSSRIVSHSGSSSAFWDSKITPVSSSADARDSGGNREEQRGAEESFAETKNESVDSRVQTWLQDSIGNLSTSSGFKSCASDATSRSEPFASLQAMIRQKRDNVPATPASGGLLPPQPPKKSFVQTSESSSLQHSNSSNVLISSTCSKQSVLDEAGASLGETSTTLMSSNKADGASVKQEERKISRATFVLKGADPDSSGQKTSVVREHEQLIERMSSSSSSLRTAPIISGSPSLHWIQPATIADEFEAEAGDSLSGAGSAELESSSSLLDQLRTRGYRSMINQRLIIDPSQPSVAKSVSSSSSVAATTTSSQLVTTTTSSNTRVVRQIFTSSSSTKQETSNNESVADKTTEKGNEEESKEEEEEEEEKFEAKAEETLVEEEEEELEDDDVKQAKANIKGHLERMKETELFLKNMHQEEEQLERQRRETFLFNNLMISSKLNGLNKNRLRPFEDSPTIDKMIPSEFDSSPLFTSTGARSAPVRNHVGLGRYKFSSSINSNGFIPSEALSFEPTFSLARDPLEPVQPIYLNKVPNSINDFSKTEELSHSRRRSRSQLSDSFEDYKQQSRGPVCPEQTTFVRSKRSLSQIRCPPASCNRFSQPNMMSEYRSAFNNFSSLSNGFSNHSDETRKVRTVSVAPDDDDDEDDDDGMSAYRASSYVPKVVPQGIPARGRSHQRRSWQTENVEEKPDSLADEPKASDVRQRRISFGSTLNDESKLQSESFNRRSSLVVANVKGDSSRLSELEQRIQENKKRREELLSGMSGLSPASKLNAHESARNEPDNSLQADTSGEVTAGQALPSTLSSSSKSVSKFNRPSRLESMEARIKRKSYCVKVGDCSPERAQLRSQQSLEKWRQNSILSKQRSDSESKPQSPSILLSNTRRDSDILEGSSFEKWRQRNGIKGDPETENECTN